jgi:hypothetical protein
MSKRSSGGHVPAGGINSNKRVDIGVRTGSGAHGIRPAHVSQTGTAVDPKSVERRETKAPEARFGNEVALNVGGGGPGVGRDVHPTGAQGVHGPVAQGNPRPAGRDILGGFGPEKSS